MPYCPLKMMASRIAEAVGQKASGLPPMLKLQGTYDAGDECDKDQCGFWSAASSACGIAATANVPPQPLPPQKEDEAAKPLVGNVTTA